MNIAMKIKNIGFPLAYILADTFLLNPDVLE